MFEGVDGRCEDVLSVAQHRFDGCVDVGLQQAVLCRQVDDGNHGAATAFSSTSTRPLLPQSIRASRSGRERHPSSTNISRSMSLFSSVMCEGCTANCVVKS